MTRWLVDTAGQRGHRRSRHRDLASVAVLCRALLVPPIVRWEDRATGWSGKPDQITIKLRLEDLGPTAAARALTVDLSTNIWGASWSEWGNRPLETLRDEQFEQAVLQRLSG